MSRPTQIASPAWPIARSLGPAVDTADILNCRWSGGYARPLVPPSARNARPRRRPCERSFVCWSLGRWPS